MIWSWILNRKQLLISSSFPLMLIGRSGSGSGTLSERLVLAEKLLVFAEQLLILLDKLFDLLKRLFGVPLRLIQHLPVLLGKPLKLVAWEGGRLENSFPKSLFIAWRTIFLQFLSAKENPGKKKKRKKKKITVKPKNSLRSGRGRGRERPQRTWEMEQESDRRNGLLGFSSLNWVRINLSLPL